MNQMLIPALHRTSHCGSSRVTTALSLLTACLLAVLLAGCSSESELPLHELELLPVGEELIEFPLGQHVVPIPVASRSEETVRNGMQLAFRLHALLPSARRGRIAAAWERHEGMLRDRVLDACRVSTLNELRDPELAALKARLLDTVQRTLGTQGIRRIVMTEVLIEEI